MSALLSAQPPCLDDARAALVGRPARMASTPALLLDLSQARKNIDLMAERTASLGVNLRPHVKVHKSPELALIQIEAGAIGVTTATVWEAAAMAAAGVDDILVANQLVTPAGVEAAAHVAAHATISVCVDDEHNLAQLAAAARRRGVSIGVFVEVDVGMGRGGVRSADRAVALARAAVEMQGTAFRGVSGYEGHCMLEPDRDERVRKAHLAMDQLHATVATIEAADIDVPIVSGGGTGTYDITGPRLTELQAGSYVVMDAFHASLIPDFPIALTVLATVVSRDGDTIVLDAGRKAVSSDLAPPVARGLAAEFLFINEEHSGYRVSPAGALRVGDVVELEPGYGPTSVNLYDSYYVVENGAITDLWPVTARYGLASAGIPAAG